MADIESVAKFVKFLEKYNSDQLRSILVSSDPRLHYPLYVDFIDLWEDEALESQQIVLEPNRYFPLLDEAAKVAQKNIFANCKSWEEASVKEFVHVRIDLSHFGLPEISPNIGRVRVKHHGILIILKGTVIRSGAIKMIEGEQEYQCRKCKHRFKVYPELESRNSIPKPIFCPSKNSKFCESTSFQPVEGNRVCHDYQEIRIQESTQVLGVGAIPRSVSVILKDDLVDIVKAGVALTLIGGVQHVDGSGSKVRGDSHLLVGDPGTGKSQFLKFAAKLSNRSVVTTGLGSSSAGLTVTAVKDGGEWMLEAEALVLADGGICCIDEFDSMREHDRATIHEAMEQQTISIAKAGLVTTLSTRTIVFGATNPKGHYDPEQSLSVNTTLSGPLLSRFDIVLVLLDTKNPEWDAVVSSHILAEAEPDKSKQHEDLAKIWPLPMLRRYIHFVRRHFRPVLTKEAEKVISSYYQLQRRSAVENAARTTVRMLESLIRLAQAHARLMFRNEVTQLDAITAILCIESSMTTSAIVDSAGNALHSNFTENPDQEYAMQEQLILKKLNSVDEFMDIITN